MVTKFPVCLNLNIHVRMSEANRALTLPILVRLVAFPLTFRHRASCILGQAFRYSPENAFYIFNQQIYFII